MKHIKLFVLGLALIGGFAACDKNDESPVPLTMNTGKSYIKLVYTSSYARTDSIQIKLNDTRVSNTFLGISSTNLPTPFPGGGLNTGGSNFPYYLEINPGNTKVFVSVPKVNSSVDSIIKYSGYTDLEVDKYYTAYIADTVLNARLFIFKENKDSVPNGLTRFRFINLIPNLPGVDLYFGTNLVAGNIAYGTASPEFTIAAATTSQWRIRPAGASPTSTALAQYPTGTTNTTIPNKRIMTVFAKGYSGATGVRAPSIHLLYN